MWFDVHFRYPMAMATMIKYDSAEGYYSRQSAVCQRAMEKIREIIVNVVPETEELLNYGIPAYTLKPGVKREEQIMIAGYAKHVGFYPHPTTIAHFEKELAGYAFAKGSVQFPLNKPLPEDLIRRMVRYRWQLVNAE
jgi:uncharacterized protein YdhG (YjbR/CyaY superfamily)